MKSKLKGWSVILFIIFSFYILTEISIPVQAPVKVSASSVKITCHYKSTNSPYTATIGSSCKVVMPVKIGRAAKGFNVVVDVSITSKGKTYTTKTSFKPR